MPWTCDKSKYYCQHNVHKTTRFNLTSIKQKLGVGDSASKLAPGKNAPVALPGLTKNLSMYSNASNRWVPPQHRTSTSSRLASASSRSGSLETRVKPSRKPMRMPPWVTTCVRGRDVASTSVRPLTILRSGDRERRYS